MKNKIIILLLLLGLMSCISEYNPNLPSAESDLLVVQGSIVGNSLCTFYLGKNVSINSNTQQEDYHAQGIITLIDSNGSESQPATNVALGEYSLKVGELDANTRYGLRIQYNGDTYESELSYPLYTPPFDSLSYSQPVENEIVDLNVSTHDTSVDIGYYRWIYEEDWEQNAAFYTEVDYDPEKEQYINRDTDIYFCWCKTRNNPQTVISTSKLKENRIISQPILSVMPEFRFKGLYCITVTQQALSRRGYEYYENKNNINDDQGGMFPPLPSMVEGNVSCTTDAEKRVLGYIEVNLNLVTEKLFIPAGNITSRRTNFCELISPDSVETFLFENNITLDKFYKMGYLPVGFIGDPPKLIEWAEDDCVDCRKKGGSLTPPEWWPR